MRAYAKLRLGDGRVVELGHGDVIGRIWSAALHVNDPRVSEMHAALSLRGAALRLLALRGRLWRDGKPVGGVELVPGLTISLIEELTLSVVEVTVPQQVLAIEGPGTPQQILSGTISVFLGSPPQLLPGYRRDAACHLWHAGDGWMVGDGEHIRPLRGGDRLQIGEERLDIVAVSLTDLPDVTTLPGSSTIPLSLVVQPNAVRIHRRGHEVTVIDGVLGRLFAAVAEAGEAEWNDVARAIWPDEGDESKLRGRLDVTRARLRKRLRDVALSDGLITVGGRGRIRLALSPHDSLQIQRH